jgi:hypothetical protein
MARGYRPALAGAGLRGGLWLVLGLAAALLFWAEADPECCGTDFAVGAAARGAAPADAVAPGVVPAGDGYPACGLRWGPGGALSVLDLAVLVGVDPILTLEKQTATEYDRYNLV